LKTTDFKQILIHGTLEGSSAKRTWLHFNKLLENGRSMFKNSGSCLKPQYGVA
jgi:hypothetical protein